MGTTGYAKDMLKESLDADVAIVETVAHTKSAMHYYNDVDVIVDVGGQDIKVIVLRDGKVKDFKINTQCSAGNGYFLQSTAAKFGHSVAEYADVAFDAERLPVFGYGCAVFMETDIVNFQQLGWEEKEIMAGLAKVLPKNIWLYVVAEPNLSKFGTNFVLQGGTQHNLAAVKSQYDFIKSKVPGASIRVHQFTGESGAIGAALEAIRVASENDSSFILNRPVGRGNAGIHGDQRRVDAVQFLQEQVPADLYRHQDASRGGASLHHRHLRKGQRGEDGGYEGHQGQAG